MPACAAMASAGTGAKMGSGAATGGGRNSDRRGRRRFRHGDDRRQGRLMRGMRMQPD